MASHGDTKPRIDQYKLEGDLRDAYVELLSAQFAVNRIKMRYTAEEVATNGGSFMVTRSISAAENIWEYFAGVRDSLKPQAGPCPSGKQDQSERPQR